MSAEPAPVLEAAPRKPSGLTETEAAARLRVHGLNEPRLQREPLWKTILPLVADPVIIVLFLASIVAALVGEITDAIIIETMIAMSIALNFVQTFRSQHAAERLQQRVAPAATVLRDGKWQQVARTRLVPDDVIRVQAGDLVPADATLIESRDLHLYEAALTGESMPVEKEAPAAIFMGTSVVSGTGEATVTQTGGATTFGEIVSKLAARPPETEFARGTRHFSAFVTQTIFILVMFVMLSSVLLHRDALQSLLFALALAVGLAPEFLPMIQSVTFASAAVRMSRKRVIVKHLPSIQNLGSIDVLCSDKTGTITTGRMSVSASTNVEGTPSDEPLRLAALNSVLQTGINSPFDEAISRAHPVAAPPEKFDEIPFDFERRIVSVVTFDKGKRILIAKGAPESIAARCRPGFASRADVPAKFAADGLRVLAVATRVVDVEPRYTRDDERDLELAGYVAFIDPPLPNAEALIQAVTADGVRIKILTGDNEVVARRICTSVGLPASRVVSGSEVDRLTDAALAVTAEEESVFARLTPAQKTRIVLALKLRGHVVGFLGDGINDAPSLRAADVGISVANAVDVAREAADIILLDKGLDVVHEGIIQGRAAFGNVMKYVLMETSSNFGNMFSMAAASVVLPFLPMLPTQILLNNFLYDLSQVTIPTDRVDASYMRKPQRWNISMIRRFMLVIGPISSIFDFATFALLLFVFRSSPAMFQTGWFVESLTTQTLVLIVIRTAGNPLRSRPSTPLILAVGGVVALALLLPLTRMFGFVPLPPVYFLFLGILTGAYLLAVEAVKRRVMQPRGSHRPVLGGMAGAVRRTHSP